MELLFSQMVQERRNNIINKVVVIDPKLSSRGKISQVCTKCVHFHTKVVNTGEYWACNAFKEIPDAIWFGQNDHTSPYPGDRGFTFALPELIINKKSL